ncbi:glycosyl hydrolase [Cohnella hashimotonis]|uniref:Glycosyl hydrolase n=1 Tax=Cohnella hashimotonis TaxID=2826895 RepID=A0ABT6TFM3_9BACL|nr:glycosyl hydrolase [Cohnella hashimotonis]MDI4644754.1 glycosyl hydrolase [Cohnella hashimotonis]
MKKRLVSAQATDGIGRLRAKWADPPMDCRPVPFWSWNGTLEQDELNAQVDGFKTQGMGGFMMHVREGLETPYLGEAFMDRIRDTVAKAEAEGMQAWLYDEDKYSSGMGGGQVGRIGGDAVRAKALSLTVARTLDTDDSIQAAYVAVIEGDALRSCERLAKPDADAAGHALAEGEVYLVLRRHVAAPNEWCHGDAYPDALNPEAARLFIETTHEKYKVAVGEAFGRTIPAIFTDEPSIRGFHEGLNRPDMTWIAWSDVLPEAFLVRNGYEVWELLPYFFFCGPHAARIRHDYWATVTERFVDAYTRQLADWCRTNGIALAGHYCEEGSLIGAALHCGAVMPHYRYLDVPGIDTLCEQTDESLTVKQASSVANQYGRKKVITETYGVTGWGLTFESRKWIGDWQLALGVNVLTHHLALYTLRGCRKRDYPPSFNYNVNWWPHNRTIEDYFARLGAVLSEGNVRRDVLVVHPTSSVWTMLGRDVQAGPWRNRAGIAEELEAYNKAFNELIDLLHGEHYDFDLGDETILREVGAVEGDRLIVGQAGYRVAVLPDLRNLARPTLELLIAYMEAGGIVLSYGDGPNLLDGREAGKALSVLTGHSRFMRLNGMLELPAALAGLFPRPVSLRGRDGAELRRLLCMRRELPDGIVVFAANNDREAGCEARIRIEGTGTVERWDPLSGESTPVASRQENGFAVFEDRFGPADSRLYVLRAGEAEHGAAAAAAGTTTDGTALNDELARQLPFSEPWLVLDAPVSFSRSAPNALVLDRCRYRLGDEAWLEEMDVWQAQRELRERLGMRQVYANGKLQRYLWIGEPHPRDGAEAAFRFSFDVSRVPEGEVRLAFEQAERFRFALNGRPLAHSPDGWYLDRCLGTVKLPRLAQGENALDVSCAYTHDMELEDAYLLGSFALDSRRGLIRESERLTLGDWCGQGYPHYCGSMIYRFEFTAPRRRHARVFMEMGPYEAVTVKLTINSLREHAIPWRAAGTVELTPWLTDGINALDIEIAGSPRNLLGPLHEAKPGAAWTDWWSFRPTGDAYSPEYRLQPYGLMGPVKLFAIPNSDY